MDKVFTSFLEKFAGVTDRREVPLSSGERDLSSLLGTSAPGRLQPLASGSLDRSRFMSTARTDASACSVRTPIDGPGAPTALTNIPRWRYPQDLKP